MRSLRTLLHGVIDYAGLFPPAGLDMATAARNYGKYRRGADAWALGRFIVPVGRLGEFRETAAPLLEDELEPWHVSALVGADAANDLATIEKFNGDRSVGAVIDTIEVKAADALHVNDISRMAPRTLDTFFEVPHPGDAGAIVRAIGGAGRKAKIRTGGVTENLFPSVEDVAAFIDVCRREDVAFKATAGLHHPLRAEYRLTYESDSASAIMHGFLNVFVAACFRHAGVPREDVETILSATSGDDFEFDDAGMAWRKQRLVDDGIETARSRFAMSFGSCSFEEPIGELRGMQLI